MPELGRSAIESEKKLNEFPNEAGKIFRDWVI